MCTLPRLLDKDGDAIVVFLLVRLKKTPIFMRDFKIWTGTNLCYNEASVGVFQVGSVRHLSIIVSITRVIFFPGKKTSGLDIDE
jgi:hypothetical protein